MNIDFPGFSLKSPRCECCDGQGALCFATCPKCEKVALVCDEVGTVFLNLGNLDEAIYGGLEDPNCMCSNCGAAHISKFKNSTDEEIQVLGYDVSEYG